MLSTDYMQSWQTARQFPKPRQLTIAYKAAHAADPRPDETYFSKMQNPLKTACMKICPGLAERGKVVQGSLFGPKKTFHTYVSHFFFAQGEKQFE